MRIITWIFLLAFALQLHGDLASQKDNVKEGVDTLVDASGQKIINELIHRSARRGQVSTFDHANLEEVILGKPSEEKTLKAKQGDANRPKIKLTYLNIKGLGEPIRLALFIGGLKFEDCRVDYQGVKALRKSGKSPWGQVPVLQVDGKAYGQSQAILRWAGRQAGLYSDDVQLKCDAVLDAIADMTKLLLPLFYGAAIPGRHPVTSEVRVPLTEEQKQEVVNSLNEMIPGRLKYLDRFLGRSGGPWFCGNKLTICDLAFHTHASTLAGLGAKGIDPEIVSKFARLRAHVKRVSEHQKVKEWYTIQRYK